MKIDFDFRLLDVSSELFTLEDFLEIIEKQIDHVNNSEKLIRDDLIKKQNLSPNDPEWHEIQQIYDYRIDVLIPRLFRSPFLVSLYAVYESAVIEMSRLIQKKQGQHISLNDIKGDFLDQAKKYYKHILRFELCKDNTSWQYITMLSELRHAIAHTNGRLDMLKEKSRKSIRKWEKEGIGIEINSGYIIVDSDFLKRIFGIVHSSLEELIQRYKQWDSAEVSDSTP